jgi:hypothetical protein
LTDLSYRLDASDVAPSDVKRDLSLVLAIPDVNFVVHASYVDQYIRRSDHERKAAWKKFQQSNQLELPMKEGERSDAPEEGKTVSREADAEFKAWPDEEDKKDDSTTEDEAAEKPAEPMTILEALKKMK